MYIDMLSTVLCCAVLRRAVLCSKLSKQKV